MKNKCIIQSNLPTPSLNEKKTNNSIIKSYSHQLPITFNFHNSWKIFKNVFWKYSQSCITAAAELEERCPRNSARLHSIQNPRQSSHYPWRTNKGKTCFYLLSQSYCCTNSIWRISFSEGDWDRIKIAYKLPETYILNHNRTLNLQAKDFGYH